jgi:hypothetical protein
MNAIPLLPFPPYWHTYEIDDLGVSLKLIERALMIPLYHLKDADALAADTLLEVFFSIPVDGYLIKPRIIPHAALTADNTDYATLRLDRTGIATVYQDTTQVTGTGDWVAGTPIDMTMIAANNKVEAGETIRLRILKAASGVIVPRLGITAYFVPRVAP